jgi:hypothetical protein
MCLRTCWIIQLETNRKKPERKKETGLSGDIIKVIKLRKLRSYPKPLSISCKSLSLSRFECTVILKLLSSSTCFSFNVYSGIGLKETPEINPRSASNYTLSVFSIVGKSVWNESRESARCPSLSIESDWTVQLCASGCQLCRMTTK